MKINGFSWSSLYFKVIKFKGHCYVLDFWYWLPEIGIEKEINAGTDICCLGSLLFEIIPGNFLSSNLKDQMMSNTIWAKLKFQHSISNWGDDWKPFEETLSEISKGS